MISIPISQAMSGIILIPYRAMCTRCLTYSVRSLSPLSPTLSLSLQPSLSRSLALSLSRSLALSPTLSLLLLFLSIYLFLSPLSLPVSLSRWLSGRMPDSQSREPGFESPLIPFRSLGIFFHFTTPQSTQLYK